MIVRPKIEQYAAEHTSPPSPLLAEVAAATESATERPEMMVGALEGALLAMLVAMQRPRRILEIGTFTGYSALSMAEAMPAGCRIVTLEADAHHAALARRHFAASPYADRIELCEGPALDTLAGLTGPFDLMFFDADKRSYIRYLDAVLPLLSEHGVVAVDNALQFAITTNAEDAASIKAFNSHVAGRADLVQVLLTVRAGLTLIRRAPAR
ncbi:class I SAM-dependent methyltransferase [Amorphoplanes nipponensis]|uniref:O-methyltransferase n=1 Tax=Actinoplanes nipponensis TaxID=135950 RepID=A0A919JJJ5_9ACTN|nr:O-methyltransferase [Actinoplanes nipponensis]GIE51731.1 O-methyltransferase [Actinoplanes nipponensis]